MRQLQRIIKKTKTRKHQDGLTFKTSKSRRMNMIRLIKKNMGKKANLNIYSEESKKLYKLQAVKLAPLHILQVNYGWITAIEILPPEEQ